MATPSWNSAPHHERSSARVLGMPQVSISIPTMLRDCTKGERVVKLEASSAKGALEQLLEQYPLLKFHLLDTDGNLRTHLVIFHDGVPIHPLSSSDVVFTDDQEIHILQAVSGG
jgi:sulfur-carrier protein